MRQFRRSWPLVMAVGLGLVVEIIVLLVRGRLPLESTAAASTSGNTEQLADVLFSAYFVPFELASILLLVAIVGSIWMGQRRPSREAHPSEGDVIE